MSLHSDPSRPPAARSPAVHVGIIMDGNGRWAQARGLPRFEGHRRGVEAVRRAVRAAIECGVVLSDDLQFLDRKLEPAR